MMRKRHIATLAAIVGCTIGLAAPAMAATTATATTASGAGYWLLGNNLVHHLWSHRALMQLDLGECDAVLGSYDTNIRNLQSPLTKAVPDQFNDLQNATALLWRLWSSGRMTWPGPP